MQKQFSVADVISVCNVSDVSNTQHNIVFTKRQNVFSTYGASVAQKLFFRQKNHFEV